MWSDSEPTPTPQRPDTPASGPRINTSELVIVSVQGQIAHPVAGATPYRIGHDGVPRVLPGTGGIVLNQRIGDLCVGLAGDHIEPGVSLHNNNREVIGPRDGPNNALITYACVGNVAEVLNGRCIGRRGLVTGKHGGVNHVMVDFPTPILARLSIGDRISIRSHGLGLRFLQYPQIEVMNCDPALIGRWGLIERDGRLHVPVTHLVPARLMGSGLGKNTAWRGDYDIQLSDRPSRERWKLTSLRFGDLVAIVGADVRRGPIYRESRVTIGVIVHGDSTVSGHGPGVTPLLTGPAACLRPLLRPSANLAEVFQVRRAQPPRPQRLLVERDPRRRSCPPASAPGPRLAFETEAADAAHDDGP
ncbi:protein of unknown function [Roseateles sp. YR242]|uniref:DUF4438 domain-containing protein n=1 Tax=Roseateles sp. YR242 TaxID=1855305 RepID=UPI0008B4C22A|nr:DUF4438 domain-containing protein [Roseateles sp. YR242]SEK24089.1 protein of unknown function [Roseateles sp. YR242]